MTPFSTSWKRTAGIVIIDLHRFFSFYLARFMVWRTLRAKRKAAQRNFKELRKTAAEREHAQEPQVSSLFWFFLR